MTLSLKPFRRCVILLARAMEGLMVLAFYVELLSDASWTRWVVCTLPLFIFPAVLGSCLNLKEHGRWLTYYVIWIQLMTSPSENYFHLPGWDLILFLSIEGTYRRYLQTLVGDKFIPPRVYLSSWISDDSKLSAFLAAHKIVESNTISNNDDVDEKHDGHVEQKQTVTTTITIMTIAKWVYALVIGALVLNTYLCISVKYWDYDCSRMIDAYDALTSVDEIDEYSSYCHPSPWRRAFRFTFLTWPYPESFVAIVTAYFCAAAWSTLPTKIVIRAWIRMWSNGSCNDGSGNRRRSKLFAIRKIHYCLFFYLLKGPTYVLIDYISTSLWNDLEILDHERHLFLGALVFYYASSLVFALVLLWNLYVVHSGQNTCQVHQRLLLQGDGFKYLEKVGDRGEAGSVSESEKTPFLDAEAPSVHVVDMSSSSH
ncbi:hypothetical protein BKA57DRAFT_461854 [Linnemannia elongata]|nr:hypothetical protein BKA57DRAFT_461854 [Linnemannia elongata]